MSGRDQELVGVVRGLGERRVSTLLPAGVSPHLSGSARASGSMALVITADVPVRHPLARSSREPFAYPYREPFAYLESLHLFRLLF